MYSSNNRSMYSSLHRAHRSLHSHYVAGLPVQEASMRQSLLRQCEADERIRQIHLTQMRKEEKMRHLREV